MNGTRKILGGVVGIIAAWLLLIGGVSLWVIGAGLGGKGLALEAEWVQTTFGTILFLSGPIAVVLFVRRASRKSAEEFVRETEDRIGSLRVRPQ